MSIEESCPAVMYLLPLWRETFVFYSSCSFYFHIFCGIAFIPAMTSPISSSKSHKNAISQLAWDYMILMHFSQGRSERTFYFLAATCLGVETAEIHSCLGNKVLPTYKQYGSGWSYEPGFGALRVQTCSLWSSWEDFSWCPGLWI